MQYPARNLQQLCRLIERYDRPVSIRDIRAGLNCTGEPGVRRCNNAISQNLIYRIGRVRATRYMLAPLGLLVCLNIFRFGGVVPAFSAPIADVLRRLIRVSVASSDDVRPAQIIGYAARDAWRYLAQAHEHEFVMQTQLGYYLPTERGIFWLSLLDEYRDYAKYHTVNDHPVSSGSSYCSAVEPAI